MLYEIKKLTKNEFVKKMLESTNKFSKEGLESLFLYLDHVGGKMIGGMCFNQEQIENEWIEGDLAFFSYHCDMPIQTVLNYMENNTVVLEVNADQKVYIIKDF